MPPARGLRVRRAAVRAAGGPTDQKPIEASQPIERGR
jgi:hypothetical protein